MASQTSSSVKVGVSLLWHERWLPSLLYQTICLPEAFQETTTKSKCSWFNILVDNYSTWKPTWQLTRLWLKEINHSLFGGRRVQSWTRPLEGIQRPPEICCSLWCLRTVWISLVSLQYSNTIYLHHVIQCILKLGCSSSASWIFKQTQPGTSHAYFAYRWQPLYKRRFCRGSWLLCNIPLQANYISHGPDVNLEKRLWQWVRRWIISYNFMGNNDCWKNEI